MSLTWQRWVLPNGLVVLNARDPGAPLATCTVMLRSGSLQEHPPQAGLNSLTMDLMIQGTRHRSARQIADEIESIGGALGAQGHDDYTDLGVLAPEADFAHALEVLADVIRCPTYSPAEILKERAQVLSDLNTRQDAIFNVAYDRLNEALYGDHPYGRTVDGRARAVRRFTRRDLRRWHQRHVRPDRMILSMLSPWPRVKVERLLDRLWGGWTAVPTPTLNDRLTDIPVLTGSRQYVVRSRFEQAYLMRGTHAPAVNREGYSALKVLNVLMGGGMSSRLFVGLREEMGLAYEVSSFYPTRIDESQWVIYLGLPAEKVSLAERRLNQILEKAADQGPTRDELRQAQRMIRGSYVMENQPRRRQSWYAAWWELQGKDPNYGPLFLKSLERVTREEVRASARVMMNRPAITVKVIPR